MKGTKPQKQLLQFVMLSLLSVVSVLMMSGESFAALDCGGCHGAGTADMRPLDGATRNPATGAFVGSHQKHLGSAVIPATQGMSACTACHSNASHTPDASYNSSHRDGSIQLSTTVGYSKGVFFNQTSVPTLSSCSTAVCHNSTSTTVGIATPVWGTTATCSSCHATSPATLSHQKHLTTTTFKKAVCIDCHAGTTEGVSTTANHVNNSISVTGYTAQNKTKGSAVSTCTATYCHSSGQSADGTSATPVYSSVTWGGTVTCGSCHATTSPNFATGSHTGHLAKNTNCGNCHTGASATAYASTAHVDGSISVAGGVGYTAAGTAGNGYGTCSTATCHSPFLGGTAAAIPAWGGAVDCNSCHDQVQTSGAHSTHYTVAAIGFNCSRCHTSSSAATHANGFTNVSGSMGRLIAAPVAKHAAGDYTATCTTTCHSAFTTAGVTPVWDAQSDCNTCHTANTGAHTAHNASAAVIAAATGGLAANTCGVCHAGATTTVVSTGHANGVINVTQIGAGTTPKHAAGAYSATCTTSCHNPDSTSVAIATPNWGTTGVACTVCHTAGFAVTGPATGSHAAHTAAVGATCISCHTAGTTTSSVPGAGHLDGNIDVANVGYTANKTKGSAKESCSTASCHANPYGVGTVTTPVWGVASGCKSCHTTALTNDFAAGPATGSHAAHMTTDFGITVTCASCHTTPGSGATHNDSSVNVNQYASPVAKHAAGTYLANGCAAASCHTGSGMFPAKPATWGGALDCAGCHSFPPATAYHTGITSNCNSCHPDVSAGTVGTTTITVPAQHMDNIVQGGQCDSCHGYPPVQTMAGGKGTNVNYSSAKLQNYSGGGGAHSVAGHLALTLKSSNGNAFAGCVNCHPSDQHNGGAGTFLVAQVQVKVPDSLRFNNTVPVTYDRTGGAGSKTTGTCSNVSCHFKATPIWSTETFTLGH